MRAVLGKARTRLGVAVVGASLLAVGGTATAAVVATSPASDSSIVEPSPEATTSEPPATTAPAAATPAPTVGTVSTPEPSTAADPAPATTPTVEAPAGEPADPGAYDPTTTWTDQAGNTYLPAPPPTVAKLPGETGYIAPDGAPAAPPADPS